MTNEAPNQTPDKIEKTIVLKAGMARVWRALSDSTEFGQWFGMKLEGPFVSGQAIRGVITPTTVDDKVAAAQMPYEGTPVEILIADIIPEKLFSFQWHPYAVDKGHDYSAEPMTLVSFVLKPVDEGVLLTITETGFDKLPPSRRAEAFNANAGGWGLVVHLIAAWVQP